MKRSRPKYKTKIINIIILCVCVLLMTNRDIYSRNTIKKHMILRWLLPLHFSYTKSLHVYNTKCVNVLYIYIYISYLYIYSDFLKCRKGLFMNYNWYEAYRIVRYEGLHKHVRILSLNDALFFIQFSPWYSNSTCSKIIRVVYLFL